jgi:hypothetical protein
MPPQSTTTTGTSRTVLIGGRIVGALLLAAMAVIHLVLWFQGFRDIAVIGPGFMVNAVGGLILAVAVLVVGGRRLPLVAGIATLFIAGSLAALVISLTTGLFGVREQLDSPFVATSLIVEGIGTLVLAGLTWFAARPRSG